MEKQVRHVGIILDGNRRYARRLGLATFFGHKKGFEKVKSLVTWIRDLGIKELTLYCFSMQNFNRSQEEKNYLWDLFKKAADEFTNNKEVHEHKVRVRALGRKHLFPQNLQAALAKVEEVTKEYDQYTINLALAYGGRAEIVDAAKQLAKDAKEGKLDPNKIDEETFGSYLYMNSAPDLIIRTGGAHRTSNFLPWQSVYSEWFFPEKFWPEFEKEDLVKIVKEFQEERERRFGK